MTMSKEGSVRTEHTPGPWSINEIDGASLIIRSGQDSVALVYRHQGSPSLMDRHDEGIANARLITSAPDLLAALRQIQNNAAARKWNSESPDRADVDAFAAIEAKCKAVIANLEQ